MNKSDRMDNIVPFPAQPPLDAYTLALQFLERVLPSEGVYFASVKTKRGTWRDTPQPTIEDLCIYLFEADREAATPISLSRATFRTPAEKPRTCVNCAHSGSTSTTARATTARTST